MTYHIHYNNRYQGRALLTDHEAARLTLKGYTLTEEDA